MASGMAIEREVIGECFEGIVRVEVSRKMLKYVFVCPGFFGFLLSNLLGPLSGCVECNGARY